MRVPQRAHNLLSFDIEGFIESSLESMRVPERYISAELEACEIEGNTAKILEVLADSNQKATFFILGRIARDQSALVRRISEAGHEIGCHSYYHRRLYHLSFAEVQAAVQDGKKRLEDVCGRQVYGFRAPDFSIVKSNLWVLDVLLDAGYRYDSSIVPTSLHDVYGICDFALEPVRLPNGLVEVPLSAIRIWSWRLPFGGGGYLRLYPLALTRAFFWWANRQGLPGVVYVHPAEIGGVVPAISEIGWLRRFRTHTGVTTAREKLRSLLRRLPFTRIIDYLVEREMVSVRL